MFVADASSVLACMLFAFNISQPTFIFPQKITFYYETVERIMDEFKTEDSSGSNFIGQVYRPVLLDRPNAIYNHVLINSFKKNSYPYFHGARENLTTSNVVMKKSL